MANLRSVEESEPSPAVGGTTPRQKVNGVNYKLILG